VCIYDRSEDQDCLRLESSHELFSAHSNG
jgi:hypothetical protein